MDLPRWLQHLVSAHSTLLYPALSVSMVTHFVLTITQHLSQWNDCQHRNRLPPQLCGSVLSCCGVWRRAGGGDTSWRVLPCLPRLQCKSTVAPLVEDVCIEADPLYICLPSPSLIQSVSCSVRACAAYERRVYPDTQCCPHCQDCRVRAW